jgi:hypothetical protein
VTCYKSQLRFLLLLAGSEVAKQLLLLLEVTFDIISFFVYVFAVVLVDTTRKTIISYWNKAVGGA